MRTLGPSLASLAQSSWSLLSNALGGRIASLTLSLSLCLLTFLRFCALALNNHKIRIVTGIDLNNRYVPSGINNFVEASITIKNSRSDEKLLPVFHEGVKYGAGIGPGVYDIHFPRIPPTIETANKINKMLAVLEKNILWVKTDCGLKTRKYTKVKSALTNMVVAAKLIRNELAK
ncbi:hypothetical protein GYH30_047720 [Glycine max]|uniref:Cobalamin-independent methionine synthase MetE C-terminal/archaeal domain-containing protein n=2 Tax=Glycine subgen. Soja TaxID=1462606 RepID=K7MME4_SOYBN|nr:hypothetical protein JHK87_047702 [Glycine soja]KAH1119037.1 hypothetical protein GYH30_047720 [Glycine max]RZB57495.1 5-methyltetrahydropteroyltriglutamate--homocysteine methyltransferase 2 [Glycine soja]